MKLWKACLLLSGLAAAAPAAAHEVVYDSADVRIVYQPYAYDDHFDSWQPRYVVRYAYPSYSHRWSGYADDYRYRHRQARVHRHYHGCGHGHRKHRH